ncbi:hypothetical protein B9Z55_023446 [Caenorhabditis nigoni]|uniref:Uncharacterized protein n=1 Tax=Caenorhabditis nigoni TaxID=1611254 RepID=A0A2G5SQ76_9PELO|nr:hypothetical protein B9Z55_023446 [Caenorhabditis nigoni]
MKKYNVLTIYVDFFAPIENNKMNRFKKCHCLYLFSFFGTWNLVGFNMYLIWTNLYRKHVNYKIEALDLFTNPSRSQTYPEKSTVFFRHPKLAMINEQNYREC